MACSANPDRLRDHVGTLKYVRPVHNETKRYGQEQKTQKQKSEKMNSNNNNNT